MRSISSFNIKNDTLPLSNFEYSAGLTEMALLGCLAQRFNADLKYNADKIINVSLVTSIEFQ